MVVLAVEDMLLETSPMVRTISYLTSLLAYTPSAKPPAITKPFTKAKPSPLTSPEALATQKLAAAYDVSRIPGKLDHFGLTEPNVQLMLHHQLVQQDIPVEPNPKVYIFNPFLRLTQS